MWRMGGRQVWWLRAPDGSRRRIGAAGLLIGRGPDCDIVLRSAEASRAQALVHLAGDMPHLVHMGRAPTTLDGQTLEGSTQLAPGGRVNVPGLELIVDLDRDPAPPPEPTWVVEHVGGELFGVGADELSVGGSQTDDLSIPGLPNGALKFLSTAGALSVELGTEGTIDQQPASVGDIEALRSGNVVRVGDQAFRVVTGGDQSVKSTAGISTHPEGLDAVPTVARLEFLPRGGRLHLELRGATLSTYLADRRCDLVACLLSPPPPYAAGEFVPDDIVAGRVWPGQMKSRTDLNVLVHRVRKDLVRAGVEGCTLLARAPGGGATRFSVAADATVRVE
jgi:hypothetical protein